MKSTILAAAVTAALISFPPAAHADPYDLPHCDPSAADYDSRMCSEQPVNDTACTPEGDQNQCVSDWLDYQRQQHYFYNQTPN